MIWGYHYFWKHPAGNAGMCWSPWIRIPWVFHPRQLDVPSDRLRWVSQIREDFQGVELIGRSSGTAIGDVKSHVVLILSWLDVLTLF